MIYNKNWTPFIHIKLILAQNIVPQYFVTVLLSYYFGRPHKRHYFLLFCHINSVIAVHVYYSYPLCKRSICSTYSDRNNIKLFINSFIYHIFTQHLNSDLTANLRLTLLARHTESLTISSFVYIVHFLSCLLASCKCSQTSKS